MKIHARKGTGNGCDDIPLCGFNNARGWRHLPVQYVKGAKDFRNTPSVDRCQLCEDLVLQVRNRQRLDKGLLPVTSPFEGLDHAD